MSTSTKCLITQHIYNTGYTSHLQQTIIRFQIIFKNFGETCSFGETLHILPGIQICTMYMGRKRDKKSNLFVNVLTFNYSFLGVKS